MSNTDYCIVGSGRLATLLRYLLLEKGHTVASLSRQNSDLRTLRSLSKNALSTLVAINDQSIEELCSFISEAGGSPVHFSGALHINGVLGFHPLMSFSNTFLDLETYSSIPFVGCEENDVFRRTFPSFMQNPYYQIEPQQKVKYHALCVLVNNCAMQLWARSVDEASAQMGLPVSIFDPIIQRSASSWVEDKASGITGPLVRNDLKTIEAHLGALDDEPLLKLYKAFLELPKPDE